MKKVLRIPIFLLMGCIVNSCVLAMHTAVEKELLAHVFALPPDIQRHILTYVYGDDLFQENEEDFSKRVTKVAHEYTFSLKTRVEAGKDILDCLRRTAEKKLRFYRMAFVYTGIKENVDCYRLATKNERHIGCKGDRVNIFALSPNKENVAVLVNNTAIKIYRTYGNESDLPVSIFLLKEYYKKDGLITNIEDKGVYRRGYKNFDYQKKCCLNPVRCIAVSNSGAIAFANDHAIFVARPCSNNTMYRMIYQESLRSTEQLSFHQKEFNFAQLLFNWQETILAIVPHERFITKKVIYYTLDHMFEQKPLLWYLRKRGICKNGERIDIS